MRFLYFSTYIRDVRKVAWKWSVSFRKINLLLWLLRPHYVNSQNSELKILRTERIYIRNCFNFLKILHKPSCLPVYQICKVLIEISEYLIKMEPSVQAIKISKVEKLLCISRSHKFALPSFASYLSNRRVYQLSMQGDIFEKKSWACRKTIYLINVQGDIQGGFWWVFWSLLYIKIVKMMSNY